MSSSAESVVDFGGSDLDLSLASCHTSWILEAIVLLTSRNIWMGLHVESCSEHEEVSVGRSRCLQKSSGYPLGCVAVLTVSGYF